METNVMVICYASKCPIVFKMTLYSMVTLKNASHTWHFDVIRNLRREWNKTLYSIPGAATLPHPVFQETQQSCYLRRPR